MSAPEPLRSLEVRDRADQRDFERAATLAAHEMTGPITTALVAAELLESRLPDDDQVAQGLVGTVARHLRLARLQTSRFARLATGPASPTTRPTDLTALARELVDDLVLTELHEHPTHVEAEGRVEVTIDPDQLRQALYNLLTNAAHHSPPGREIVVEIGRTAQRIELRVRDQGHGVAPEAAERIFERYEREGDTTPGVGLGLPLARDIARGHGGDLELEPADRDGAVFLLALPLSVDAAT